MGAGQLRRAGLRRILREEALLHAPGAPRAGQGDGSGRAPVGAERGGQAPRRAAAGNRGYPPGELSPRGLPGPCAGPPLPGRSAGQPHDALPARPGAAGRDQGPAALAEVLARRMKRLALAAVALTFVVVVVGAYVRLSDAGLGCPDWPLCYGRPVPDHGEDPRAWKEMGHRYLAGALGILIFVLFLVSLRTRQSPRLAGVIAALVVAQATLGKWTVTMLLKPAIVVAHLLGGMALLGLLVWFSLERVNHQRFPEARALRI